MRFAKSPSNGGVHGFVAKTLTLRFFLDAVSDFDRTASVRTTMKNDAPNDPWLGISGNGYAIAPQAMIGIGANVIETGKKRSFDEGTPRPSRRHPGSDEGLGICTTPVEHGLDDVHGNGNHPQSVGDDQRAGHEMQFLRTKRISQAFSTDAMRRFRSFPRASFAAGTRVDRWRRGGLPSSQRSDRDENLGGDQDRPLASGSCIIDDHVFARNEQPMDRIQRWRGERAVDVMWRNVSEVEAVE